MKKNICKTLYFVANKMIYVTQKETQKRLIEEKCVEYCEGSGKAKEGDRERK